MRAGGGQNEPPSTTVLGEKFLSGAENDFAWEYVAFLPHGQGSGGWFGSRETGKPNTRINCKKPEDFWNFHGFF